ncbi:MAG: hypothetical protein WD751_07140 [Anaerolineales bacterium]
MKHEDWLRYQRQAEQDHYERLGPQPKTSDEKIAELRAELDSLAGRLQVDLLAQLRTEVQRLIAMEASYASQSR